MPLNKHKKLSKERVFKPYADNTDKWDDRTIVRKIVGTSSGAKIVVSFISLEAIV